ncbi:cytochrome P450 [Amycolatopsis sp. CA-126428]|uniref:cytochrome P450 n=1 Tax=Amycolatopsis sp. CA-126428 TaxID=2073158 RepID=UPI0011B09883|nr:cytochrome P450 [Amycolatopsis sp. CA-126428]
MEMSGVARGSGGADFVHGRQRRQLIGPAGVDGAGPVERVPGPGGVEWLVTGYHEAREVLRDDRFGRAAHSASLPLRGPAVRMSVTELDRPAHTRIRGLIGGAFSARRVEQLRPRVEELADELLRDVVGRRPGADLLTAFCGPLTFAAHCELLGVPPHRRERIRRCAVERLGTPSACPAETHRAELRLHDEVSALLTGSEPPATGLLAELLAEHRRGILGEEELTGLGASLFFDGFTLAATQIANVVLYLLTGPGRFARLRDDQGALDGVVEESLRYSPSAPMSMTRVALEDVVIGGRRIHAGDRVTAALALANRDDARFERPCRFDADRHGNRHLAFGFGTHHCVGAHLARVEIRAALGALLRQAPNLRLEVDERDIAWFASATIRGPVGLPVRWEP